MIFWMIYDTADYEKNRSYFNMHVEKAKEYNIDIQLILTEQLSYGIKDNIYSLKYNNEDIFLPSCVIMRSRNYILSKHLENMGVKVYNNSFVSYIGNNKFKTYEFLKSINIPIIPTIYIPKAELPNKLEAIKQNSSIIPEEQVIKSVDGHGGSEVYLLSDYLDIYFYQQQTDIAKDMVLQPLIKGAKQDVRVYVLNNAIIGAVVRTAPDDSFKSNYSLGGDVALYNLNSKEIDTVYKIIDRFTSKTASFGVKGLFYAGIDFIINEHGEFVFNEIEDVVGSRMLYKVSEIDIVEEFLKNILSNC